MGDIRDRIHEIWKGAVQAGQEGAFVPKQTLQKVWREIDRLRMTEEDADWHIDRLRAELAERDKAVPDGFELWRDENGDLRLDDLKRDLHIIVPSYYPQHGDLWLKVVGGLLDAMLTAAPEAQGADHD